MAFMGKVYVRNTAHNANAGCPVVQASVCAFEKKTLTGGSTQNFKLSCRETDADGAFNLALPIGSIVHNITVSYFNHEFSPAVTNPFSSRYDSGIVIDPRNTYIGNDFVDLTIAPVEIDVVGGLCNKTMGTAFIKVSILGCRWEGYVLEQTETSIHYVPAFVIQFYVDKVTDSSNVPISAVGNYFNDKPKTVDLRKWIDPTAAMTSVDMDASGAALGVTAVPMANQASTIQYIRFQYDGKLKLSFEVLTAEAVGRICKQNFKIQDSCAFDASSCNSHHVINSFSILEFNVHVYFEILPSLTCDIVQEGTIVTLQNRLRYENIPNFDQSNFFLALSQDQQENLMKCYPTCVNDITYATDDTQLSDAG